MKNKPTHYVQCECGADHGENNDPCECNILCNQWVEFAQVTGVKKWVTCKNCQRILAAHERAK